MPLSDDAKIDVLYLAWNRLEFTKATFRSVLLNTNWDLVRELIVYEDGSKDGTREYLDAAVKEAQADGVPARLTYLGFGSPVATMNYYLSGDPAWAFAKVDSDIAVPAGWLDVLAGVMNASDVELLGMQAGMADEIDVEDGGSTGYWWQPSSHIGGIGLMRSSAFLSRTLPQADGRFGFTNWQNKQDPRRGWITPDLMVPQLDLLPMDPWRSLSEDYIARGWQRRWPPYNEASHRFWDWFIEQEENAA